MAKGTVKEQVGAARKCAGCGRVGRERLRPGMDDVPVKSWCCSASCAEKVMGESGWGSIGWLKI